MGSFRSYSSAYRRIPIDSGPAGAIIFESLGYPNDWTWRPVVVPVAFIFVFLLGSGAILRFLKVEMSISRARTTEIDSSVGKEQINALSVGKSRTAGIVLDEYSLSIQKYNAWGSKAASTPILKPINVIMGPSGCGKTSLLNSMASRLHSNFRTRYKTGATMT